MLLDRLISRYLCRLVFCRNSSSISPLTIKDIISIKPLNGSLSVQGWVQAVRRHKDNVFVDLIDGSCLDRLQIVIKPDSNRHPPSFGSSIGVQGILMKSEHKGQDVELLCDTWQMMGSCPEDYPFLARHEHKVDYIRQLPHLRSRTRTFSSVLRVRDEASWAVQKFFREQEFNLVHTPKITLNDCEGGGEVFYVDPRNKSISEDAGENSLNQRDVEQNEKQRDEFFKYPAFLTVSGQFHLEAMIGGFRRVYDFGPVFRAENNRTLNHLSEFYMIEAEMAFVNSLGTITELVEDLLKNVITCVVNTCSKEIDQICLKYSKSQKEYLGRILSAPFLIMTYSEAVEVLEKYRKSLQVPLKLGEDFGSEHKKFIIKYCRNTPVFITDFPTTLRSFYVKDENGKAQCFDLLAPFGSEICSGSLREENYEVLEKRFQDMGLIQPQRNPTADLCSDDPKNTEVVEDVEMEDPLAWYLDLRKYGSVSHGGFGVGFDRLLQTILGIPNIRDVVPFPRWRNHCKC